MRPLVVSLLPRPPHPTRDGGAIRNFHLLRALAAEYRVRAVALLPPDAQDLPWEFPDGVEAITVPMPSTPLRTFTAAVRSIGGRPLTVAKYDAGFLDKEVRSAVETERPAWVVAHGFHLAGAALRTNSPAWADLHNVESVVWRRTSAQARSLLVRLAATLQASRFEQLESAVLRRLDAISVVSSEDARLLEARVAACKPVVVPNGVDLERYSVRPEPAGATLAFVGDLRWRPNAEGVAWFHRSVWPKLRDRLPEVRVEILGRGAAAHLRRLADDRFRLIGDEPDTRSLWARAALAIVPLLSGGGTRLKILEAAAMGVPVISTTIGAEGLNFEPGAEIVIADEPDTWVEAIGSLLVDDDRRRGLAARARARVEASHDWRRIGAAFASYLTERPSRARRGP